MPCKHEGGTDPCKRNKHRACLASKQTYKREDTRSCSSFKGGREGGRIGAACELLVQSDLTSRGYEVTVPVNPQADHDLHVELPSVGWKGVQVKSARLNANTNNLNQMGSAGNSPIFAMVYLPTRRILYRAGTEPLPEELAP
jgi:hypothetical protein